MTFANIQSFVLDRVNLTSATATTRVGNSINEGHRRVASSIGLPMIQRGNVTATTTPNNRYLTFGPSPAGVEKILAISNPAFTPPFVLGEKSYNELYEEIVATDPPQNWALFNVTSNSVTVFLDSTVATAFVLNAEALLNSTTLSGTMTPVWAEDYHDILIQYALWIEYKKLDKPTMAADAKAEYEARVSDLRFYYAKSAFKTQVQGQDSKLDVYRTIPLA